MNNRQNANPFIRLLSVYHHWPELIIQRLVVHVKHRIVGEIQDLFWHTRLHTRAFGIGVLGSLLCARLATIISVLKAPTHPAVRQVHAGKRSLMG